MIEIATIKKTPEGTQRRPRVLWINCRLLHPLIGGDRLRTYHMLRVLKEWFEITYLCPRTSADGDEAVIRALEYCDTCEVYPHHFHSRGSLGFMSGVLKNCLSGTVPYMAEKYRSDTANAWLQTELKKGAYDLVVCDYLVSLVHVMDMNLREMPPVVVFQHNVESLIWQRHADTARHFLKRWIFQKERAFTLQMEDRCASVAGQVTVSPLESRYFREERRMTNVLGDVPAGVDCEYFQPSPDKAEPHTFAFLGSMDWEANVQAVRRFAQESLPAIVSQFPDANFIVIGRNPPAWLVEMAATNPALEVTGTVDDVRPYLARASMMVLPLEVGGGTRIKVFEAMAAGLAIVSTPTGVEGLPAVHGENAWIVPPGQLFTEGVLHLLTESGTRNALARSGRELVERNFSWRSAAEAFRDCCLKVMPIAADLRG
jgi:glycosyltransferase involved in cell wall biosynthesis